MFGAGRDGFMEWLGFHAFLEDVLGDSIEGINIKIYNFKIFHISFYSIFLYKKKFCLITFKCSIWKIQSTNHSILLKYDLGF